VTGGSRGIGKAIARALYNEGAVVYIVSRKLEDLQKTAAELDTRKDGGVRPISFDVSDSASVKEAFKKIEANGVALNIVVNCAGVNLRGPAEEMPEDTWDKVMGINLKSVFLVSQAAFPMLKKNGGGKIVNICSLMSEIARPNISPYVASKGGVKQLTKAQAVEWAPHNIQANGIIPGYIATEMNIPLMEDKKFNEFIINRTPARRWGNPEDIAAAALFLASPGADFITGQTIAVDGGILASL
ncbi:MAG: SDR family oxidoreductase, partial [Methylobacteriaceae bacterium]|nr:SDR family oxidoreductase [Methylobacteriaceae bacterium]